jgi:stress response protein YsnF
MTHTVVGLFENRSEAQAAMQELIQKGFIKEHIDLSKRRVTGTSATDQRSADTGIGDSISNFFSSLFSDDQETARSYTRAASDADAILTVQADSRERATEAANILDRHNAFDVDDRNVRRGAAGTTGTAGTAGTETRNRQNVEGRERIPVIEEDIQIGKRQVEGGGARVRSRVIERPVEEKVRLREEHVVVNRHPVDREATEADFDNLREGDIELTERSEVPVVNKQARVVEEVEIGKTVEERDETIRDTVRRTDVEVDDLSRDKDDDRHTGSRRAGR